MSRTGPYASLLIALLLLLFAVAPGGAQAVLVTVGFPADRAARLASDVAVGLVVVAAGFILLALGWLLRIARREAAWLPYRDALLAVAAPLGATVRVEPPRGIAFAARVGEVPVELRWAPGEGGRLVGVAALPVRRSFLVVAADEPLGEPFAGWPAVVEADGWALRAPRPDAVAGVGRDLDLVARIDAMMAGGLVRLMGVVPGGGQVVLAAVPPERVAAAVARAFEAVGLLASMNAHEREARARPRLW